nr:LmeA family phospholipid-binding protein [Chroococcidiopsis sp. SAG 2025]
MGKIELTQPTQGKARVVLTAADINRAFNSEYIRQQLQATKLRLTGNR